MTQPRRTIPRPAPRAFTLLELILAVVLGAMVLTTALAIFVSLRNADRRNEERLVSTIQLSLTQRAIELSLRSLVLAPGTPPRPAPADNRAGDSFAVASPTPDPALAANETPALPRFILTASPDLERPMEWRDTRGVVHLVPPQRLEVVLERPPVFGEPLPGENYQPVVHRAYASRRDRDRARDAARRDEERARRRASSGPSSSTDQPADPNLPPDEFDNAEPAIAAGVRGVFELTWVPTPPPVSASEPRPTREGTWTLWWRTLPPLAAEHSTALTPTGLGVDEIIDDPMYRPVRLVAGLVTCRWEVVRAGETRDTMSATWWDELPAYVTLEIRTTSGKWSKWMFEVQGTRGPEPGTEFGADAAQQSEVIDPAARQAGQLSDLVPDVVGATPPRRSGAVPFTPTRTGKPGGGGK